MTSTRCLAVALFAAAALQAGCQDWGEFPWTRSKPAPAPAEPVSPRPAAPAARPKPTPKPASHVEYLYPHEAQKLLQSSRDVFLLCCDYKEEWDLGHIRGSALIPVGYMTYNLENNRLYTDINHGRTPRKDQPILLYCMGKKCHCPSIPTYSSLAKKILVEKGYQRIYILAGGMPAWKKAKLPYDKKPGAVAKTPASAKPAATPAAKAAPPAKPAAAGAR